MDITEENFIYELKNKNEKALDYVIDNYLAVLKTVINKHLFYLEDRKDECINDCLLAIWENIDSFDPQKSTFKSWIGGIAKFKSIDYIRKYLRDRDLENIDYKTLQSKEDSLDRVLKKELKDQVKDLLSHLSKDDEKIFIETYFKDKTAREISEKTRMKESTIYNRLSRGRKKLRLLIGGRNHD